jgi:hypothetical protein
VLKYFLAVPLLFLAPPAFDLEADTPVTPGASREERPIPVFCFARPEK